MMRTITGSMPKYSASPPHTPPMRRSSFDRYRRRGPSAAPPVDVEPPAPGGSAGGSGEGVPAPVPACSVVGSWSFDSMAGSIGRRGRSHHWESSLGDGAPGEPGAGQYEERPVSVSAGPGAGTQASPARHR